MAVLSTNSKTNTGTAVEAGQNTVSTCDYSEYVSILG